MGAWGQQWHGVAGTDAGLMHTRDPLGLGDIPGRGSAEAAAHGNAPNWLSPESNHFSS